jgi:DNA primase
MNRVCLRLEISLGEFARLLKLRTAKPLEAAEPAATTDEPPVSLDPTARDLALVALHDAAARAWILAEPWQRLFADDPDSALLVKILAFDLQPGHPASIHAFLTTLSAAEEAAVSGLLENRAPAHPLVVAHDCCRDLERRQVQRRIEAISTRFRLPNLDPTEVSKLQKEVLDLQKRLLDIARPLSPPL